MKGDRQELVRTLEVLKSCGLVDDTGVAEYLGNFDFFQNNLDSLKVDPARYYYVASIRGKFYKAETLNGLYKIIEGIEGSNRAFISEVTD